MTGKDHTAAIESKTIALCGNPNSGKTTLFNALTGLRYKVANYPGVTVERKEGRLRPPSTLSQSELTQLNNLSVIDLPGIYSLGGYAPDEVIATESMLGLCDSHPHPDLYILVVDAANLERNLFLASQLIETRAPCVVAVTMNDLAAKRGIVVRAELLSRALSVPVIKVTNGDANGYNELCRAIAAALSTDATGLNEGKDHKPQRWISAEQTQLAEAVQRIGAQVLASCDCETPGPGAGSTSGTQSAVQQAKSEVLALLLLSESIRPHSEILDCCGCEPTTTRTGAVAIKTRGELLAKLIASETAALISSGIDPLTCEAAARHSWARGVVSRCVSFNEVPTHGLKAAVERLATHRFWGVIIFLLIMATLFQSIFVWAELPMTLIESAMAMIARNVEGLLPPGLLRSLIVDGIIAGVGAVLVFIPQIALLTFGLGLLEDTGYLARAACIMDRCLRPIGLQGRSFVPLLSSFACAIPGMMATRTIPSFTDRLLTILIAPFMSCSARLPVYSVLIAACIPNIYLLGFFSLQGLTLLAMYLLGILGAVIFALIFKLLRKRGEPTPFAMELPAMRRPSLKLAARDTLDRVALFTSNAGSVILICSIVLWVLISFPQGEITHSIAGTIGKLIEPIILPLGFNWEIGIALLASFAAREVFVSTLATVYNVGGGDAAADSLTGLLRERVASGEFTVATALSLMVFYVFACQCMSTLAVAKRETGSWKWPAVMFFSMSAMAYLASLITYGIFR